MKVDGRTRGKVPLTTEQRELCGRYLRLAEAMARKRKNPYVPPEDRLQDAYVGLIDAARDYDPGKGFKFATYATHRILGAMIDGERERGNPGVRATRDDLAKGFSAPMVHSIENRIYRDDGEQSNLRFRDVFVAPEPAVTLDDVDAIDAALASLSERNRHVAVRHWMDGLTMKQAGAEVGVSESRTSQVLPGIASQLRNHSALADYRKGA